MDIYIYTCIGGGSAAMFASSIVHPIDLAKVRLQLFALQNPAGTPRPSFPQIITSMVKKEGISSVFYRRGVYVCVLINVSQANQSLLSALLFEGNL